MRFAFIAKHRHIWPVSWPVNWLCEVLEVSRSGFHAWLSRPTSTCEIHDVKLVAAIGTSFKTSDRTYGTCRVWPASPLCPNQWRKWLDPEEGLPAGFDPDRKADAGQCHEGASPLRRGKPEDDGERSVIAGNILDRDFEADRPNQKWLADFASRTFGSPASGPRKAGSVSHLAMVTRTSGIPTVILPMARCRISFPGALWAGPGRLIGMPHW